MKHKHASHHALMIQDFRKRFWISLAGTIPVLALSPMIQSFLGFGLRFPGDRYILFAISAFIYFFGGWPFLKGLVKEFKKKQPGMMTLIALAITVAFGYSTLVVFGLRGKIFFWELVTLIDVMLLGHWVEMRSVMGASRALEELAKLLPSQAHLVADDGSTEDVPLEELKKGDKVLVKPGGKIPVDGKILKGESELDESMVTGESKPVVKSEGQEVIGGSVNGNGSLTIEVSKTGEDSYLSQIVDLVKKIAVITSLSAKNGLLIKNRTAFESAFKLDTIVFDKTGTLTKGKFGVSKVVSLGDWSKEKVLKMAASIEKESEHSIAKAIVKKAEEEDIQLEEVKNFEAMPGKGAKAVVNGVEVFAGSESLLEKLGDIPDKEKNEIEKISAKGMTTVVVLAGGKAEGVIGLSDIVRDESKSAVKDLKDMGFSIGMITGDNEETAKSVAEELGIDEYFTEVLPDEKSKKIKHLQEKGKKVAMVGDGVNDAPALAQADLGIAIGAGTDVAAETADVILVESDPREVADIVSLSRLTRKKMKQNLAWATGYNVIAIPLAAGVLYNQGIVLAPAAGALVMSLSTVIVAINAKLVKPGNRFYEHSKEKKQWNL
jgi:Cu2+-exporting ATPase